MIVGSFSLNKTSVGVRKRCEAEQFKLFKAACELLQKLRLYVQIMAQRKMHSGGTTKITDFSP